MLVLLIAYTLLRDHRQLSLETFCDIRRIKKLLFSLKSSTNDNFSKLINSVNVRSEIWRRFLN